tara:strand:- start:218 stop:970 length:753 start_codon:yes stop_codon:yes gene_type:complete
MKIKIIIPLLIFSLGLSSCAEYKISNKKSEKKYFTSSGFALVYNDSVFEKKTLNRKLDNNKFYAMHSFLKKNTIIKIINPENSKFLETKIYKNADYPSFFNLVITEKIAAHLDLDTNNPYIEFMELKKNKKFIAKEGHTYDEEKNVAEKAPVDEILVDDLSKDNKTERINENNDKRKFIILISDFYYFNTANTLKDDLIKKTQNNSFSVKKINKNKYRLLAGPFKNFNALKTTYISLNNLGFENLNVYRE